MDMTYFPTRINTHRLRAGSFKQNIFKRENNGKARKTTKNTNRLFLLSHTSHHNNNHLAVICNCTNSFRSDLQLHKEYYTTH